MPREPRVPPHVELVPMSEAERRDALEREAREYGEAKARAGFWPRTQALGRARAEIAAALGPRPDEAGHRFYRAMDASGRRVGWVWTGPVPGTRAGGSAWVYQIEIDESLRGRGLGRALLKATEDALRDAGCPEVRLNVFSWNTVAVALYGSAGYEVVSRYESGQEMRKLLRPL